MEYTKAHQKTYVKYIDIFCNLMKFTCLYSLQASMHAACSMPPVAISWQFGATLWRLCKNNYKQSCQPGWHENMKTCVACGVWCAESLMQVTCNKKHFYRVTHFCFTCVKQIVVCVQVCQACNRVTWIMPGKLCFACNRTTLPPCKPECQCSCTLVCH